MEEFDRTLLSRLFGITRTDPRPPGVALGLSPGDLALLFPGLGLAGDGSSALAHEEDDLRALLLEYKSPDSSLAPILAPIIARRTLEPNHLWQDLGLAGRAELSELMRRHFAPLARRNARDMKWKKFLYRELCQREDVLVCKSPTCDACGDFVVCFGAEDGHMIVANTTASGDNSMISVR